ncbi:hypothetical protein A7U60_g2737 [Sanghuangporus baumii]|uniref:Uncharacterized protein n=1 Tax=Sanghuangporus baumii TaxID=108892 RepID=A0A9Q5I1R2_SANBA|nr:hypothetical protein A7U60_g2737 [Sanghuangporus baumii]
MFSAFGQQQQQQNKPLFGASAQSAPSFTFGQPQQNQQQQPQQPQQQQQQQPSGTTATATGTGLFGNIQPNTAQQPSTGLFGSSTAQQQPQQQQQQPSTGLFGQPTSTGLFGSSTSAAQPQQQQTSSLFGNTQPTTSAFGGFGASTSGEPADGVVEELCWVSSRDLVNSINKLRSDIAAMRELRARMDQAVQDTIAATRIIDAFKASQSGQSTQSQQTVWLKNYAGFPLEYVLLAAFYFSD